MFFPAKMPVFAPDNSNLRKVILLQGPVGGFFQALADGLRSRGFSVLKINFNCGDAFFAHGPGTFLFRRSPEHWKPWFAKLVAANRPAGVILFGDQRIYHRHAADACRQLGIDVWCMEEGYLRPDYITFEPDGNNFASLSSAPLPDPVKNPATLVPIRGNPFPLMARAASAYYIAKFLGHFWTPRYVHHRQRPLFSEIFYWNLNAFRKWWRKDRNSKSLIDLLDRHHKRYFVVALQVYDDLNLMVHGAGWTMQKLIETTIKSFAANADSDNFLVLKGHPLDRGHANYQRLIETAALQAGISTRVRLIDDCPMGLLLRHARGCVVVNSSSGILALSIGCPQFVLGNALFRREGLAQFGDIAAMDQFWHHPVVPLPERRDGFLKELVARTQINGAYYQTEYYNLTIDTIAQRLNTPPNANAQGQEAWSPF